MIINKQDVVRKKQYGQFFTPDVVAALAAVSTVNRDTKTIIDPMCGNGIMLDYAIDQHRFINNKSPFNITGIELDQFTFNETEKKYNKETLKYANVQIFNQDAFLLTSGIKNDHASPVFFQSFDSIIGNPPYIRYQNVAFLLKKHNTELLKLVNKIARVNSDSNTADILLRISLILPYIKSDQLDYKILEAFKLIKKYKNINQVTTINELWFALVAGYSGLSDISLPSWLLTWNLGKSNSYIGYVYSNSWKTRRYADDLKYFLFRFYKPILLIEQDGNWFDEALIPTSLMIFQRRQDEEIQTNLYDRRDRSFKIVSFNREFNISNKHNFIKAVKFINSNTNQDLIYNSNYFINFINNLDCNYENPAFSVEFRNEKEVISDLNIHDKYKIKPTNSILTKFNKDSTEATLPSILLRLINSKLNSRNFVLLKSLNISINQGLRTGFNPFFYVSQGSITNEDYPSNEEVANLLLKPELNLLKYNNLILYLKSQGVVVDDESNNNYPSVLVKTSTIYGNDYYIFPKKNLLKAIRYQKGINGNSNDLYYLIKIDKNDIITKPLKQYIEKAEKIEIIREDEVKHIFELSAVSPNIKKEKNGSVLTSWYNISLTARHYGNLYIPRVNHGLVNTYLNNLSSPLIIDANFSTITCKSDENLTYFLYALLNSIWIKLVLEVICTPMGGGALKVESIDLKKLPVPVFSKDEIFNLQKLGKEMKKFNNRGSVISRIDNIVLLAIGRLNKIKINELQEKIVDQLKKFKYKRIK